MNYTYAIPLLVAIIGIIPFLHGKLVGLSKSKRLAELKKMKRMAEDCLTCLMIEKEHCENNRTTLSRSNRQTVRNTVETFHGRKLSSRCTPQRLSQLIESLETKIAKLEG